MQTIINICSSNDSVLERYINEYKARTKRSRELFDNAKMVFAGGVSHNIRYFKPYPFFTTKAEGKYLHDVDGNVYIDYWMGHWSLILGHSHPFVAERVIEQASNGFIYGTVNKISLELASIITKLIPRIEMLRFANTGAEATMYAIRLARAYTKKRVVAKIEGGWHGFNTELLHSVNYPFGNEGLGLIDDKYLISIPFNDLSSIDILDKVKDDLACIIVEPFMGGAGAIVGDKEYLKGLEEYSKKNNALFILDEIVTAFRFKCSSMHDILGLEPDLITLGKIIGGGLPIGAIGGKKEIISLASPEFKKDERCNIGGGTFSANPLTMTAGLATLEYLKNHTYLYDELNRLGDIARREIDKVMRSYSVKTCTTGLGSLFLTHFLNDNDEVRNARDASLCNIELQKLYHLALMVHGIFFLPSKLGAISIMHNENDIKQLIEVTEKIASEIHL
ncbi:MAG: aspartate aminotransferase family protein [Candidatus Nitrosocaldaceae archaeon]